jgi:WD40 repeat protein
MLQYLQSLLKVPHCYMVLTVRADFYPELMTCLLWKTIQKHRQEVVPLDEAGLREAIVKPADSVEVFVETALVERLVADAAGEPGILPFVQETLALLWERLERRFLPLMAYEALVLPRQAYNWDGDKPLTGLQVAMANRADATLADLEDQAIARRLFLRLIQFGEGRPDTRRQQSVAALRSADDDVEQFNTTLEHLVAQRLLTRSAIESEADGQVDIAHEALINGWQQLQQWLKERRQAELTRRQLETKVAHWEGLKRAGGLLDVVELAEAKNWLDRSDAKELGYSEDLLTLLQASRAAIEATEREKEIAAKKLAEQRDQALRTQSLFLADLARQETETGNATNGILLALEALPKDMSVPKRPYVSEAEVQLYSAAFNHRERLVLQGHKDYVNNASFSPDGQHAVTASKDGTARLWDAKDGSLLAVFKGDDEDAVNNVFFSPDGRCIYNAARLLDAKDGSVLAVLKGHGGNRVRVHEASLSPNGQRIVTVAVTFGGFVVQLWNTQDGSPIAVLKGHKDEVTNASFSPDGLRIVTASNDNTARLWDAKDGSLTVILKRLWDAKDSSRIVVLKGHEDRVNNAAFSPDGLSIVTASNDNTARLWNAKDGSLLTVLQGHEDAVRNVAFSPNGQRIVTASNDNIALWDAKNGSLLAMLKGHENDVKKADFSPDGQFIVTASDDKTARLWDAKDSPLLTVLNGHKNRVNRASFSPDGQRIVTASNDNTARLWDAKDGSLLAVLKGHEDAVNRASFSPDGQRIVTASNDKTARLWDAKDGSLLNVLKLHKDLVANVFFSPDGQGIVTISHGNITRLWDAKDGSLLNVGRVKNSSFNPDGLHNSSFSPNGLLRIVMSLSLNAWLQNAKDYSQSTELKGHKGIIFKASFSPDGQHIVTASSDNTAMLWDGKDGSQLAVLKGHTDQVHDASFSPDGERIVTASIDGTARIWRFFPTTQALIDHANQIVPRYLTPEQRKQFFLPPDPSYDLIEEGEKLAKQRNIKAATAKFKEAKAVAPCHKFLNYPKDKAREIAAMSLIEKGDELVRRGRIEEAVEQFKQAQKVDERFKFGDIEDYSKRFKHD